MPGLLQAFSGGEPRLDGNWRNCAPALPADSTTLSDPTAILRLLNQLHYSRSPVTLHFENETGSHCLQTRVATVLRSKRSIVLHRPGPEDWRKLVVPGTPVEVNCFLATGQLAFVSRLWPLDPADAVGPMADYCMLALPAEIIRFQLRTAYRVSLPGGSSHAELQLPDRHGKRLGCSTAVVDLSLAGCGLQFPTDVSELLAGLTHLEGVRFSLLGASLCFEGDLRLCRVGLSPAGQSVAGLQFLPLPAAVQRQLQQLLTELQREQARRELRIS